MDKETKDILTITGSLAGGFGIVMIALIGSTHLFDFIEDSIKYNRYQEAVKEYQQCAQKYQDEHSVDVYCGEPPSSTIMI
jgi:hypothetical protein